MRYIVSARIRGFQSHDDTTIAFHPGANAITGPSDSGKSAILRALGWCLWGITPGGDFVRQGARLTSVAITYSDGTVIVRERHGKRNVYIVTLPGRQPLELYDFGRDVPAEVLQAHGMIPVGFDPDKPTVLNWASQLESAFFLTEGAPARARILGRLAGVHVIDKANRDANRDLLAISAETKQQEEEVSRLATQLEAYADLDDQEQRVAGAEAIVHQLDGILRRLDQLTAVHERFMDVNAGLAGTRAILECLAGVKAAETALIQARGVHVHHQQLVARRAGLATLEGDIRLTRSDLDRLRHVNTAAEKATRATALHRSHTALVGAHRRLLEVESARAQETATLERLAGVREAAGVIDRAAAVAQRHTRLTNLDMLGTKIHLEQEDVARQLARAQGVVRADELLARATGLSTHLSLLRRVREQLAAVTGQMAEARQVIERSKRVTTAGDHLTTIARATGRLTTLQTKRDKLAEILSSMAKGREYIAGLHARIQEAAGNYAQALQEARVCPTCLQAIDPATAARITTDIRKEGSPHVHG